MANNSADVQRIRSSASSVIGKYRKQAGLSQVALAQALGVSQPLISSWECGKVTPSIADIRAIEAVLAIKHGEMLVQVAYPKE